MRLWLAQSDSNTLRKVIAGRLAEKQAERVSAQISLTEGSGYAAAEAAAFQECLKYKHFLQVYDSLRLQEKPFELVKLEVEPTPSYA